LIEKVLIEKPDITGLAVPGMPLGSPGMGGSQDEPFEVFAFDNDGSIWVFDSR
jgi:hypothetical protein